MKVFLSEDHDEVLKIWRSLSVKNFDLIHVDAHIDFVMHRARDPQEILSQATGLKQLKQNLEYTLSFWEYEKDLDKQTNIGNYIYPAMRDGLVKNFWWVVPGDIYLFEKNFKLIKDIFARSFIGQKIKLIKKGKGLAFVKAWGREFWACTLETLPVFAQPILLDIDTDFLVVDDLSRADNTCDIGKRKPWITPKALKEKLGLKAKNPVAITIVYSTNGGFTPMVYRSLGDELAFCFDPQGFAFNFNRKAKAAKSFRRFLISGKKSNYWDAVWLEPAYRGGDNNHAPLFLAKNRLKPAQEALTKILRADSKNPDALQNMGVVFLRRKRYLEALRCFQTAIKQRSLKKELRSQIIFGLAQTNFGLKRFSKAQELFALHQRLMPLVAQSYHGLAEIYRIKKEYSSAAKNYRHALRLGFGGLDGLGKLLKLSFKLGIKEKADIIDYVCGRLDQWPRNKKNARQIWQIKQSLKKAKIL